MSSESTPEPVHIDKVRASREGHTYHDTWIARVALELLVPPTTLSAIAVEGFSTEDAQIASAAASEIADLVRYRGGVGIARQAGEEILRSPELLDPVFLGHSSPRNHVAVLRPLLALCGDDGNLDVANSAHFDDARQNAITFWAMMPYEDARSRRR